MTLSEYPEDPEDPEGRTAVEGGSVRGWFERGCTSNLCIHAHFTVAAEGLDDVVDEDVADDNNFDYVGEVDQDDEDDDWRMK